MYFYIYRLDINFSFIYNILLLIHLPIKSVSKVTTHNKKQPIIFIFDIFV